ncbi:MAG: c-type cytochrome [Cyclobacteriaceae bacterium]
MKRIGFFIIGIVLVGCTYFENDPIKFPQPDVPDPTTTLEAAPYVTTRPNKITSSYWKTADYLVINPQNLVTSQVPADDGLFNVSGLFNGLSDFNQGKNPFITMKAAYDNDSIYILISWKDTLFNASKTNWLFDGPIDPNKSGLTTGWTSQRSEDAFIFSFDMADGKKDVWNWSLALSEPLGYAIDMIENSSVLTNDLGDKSYVRNNSGSTNRSGPMYDWDGTQQELQRVPGGFTILDPGYYLLNKKEFTGDILKGDLYFQAECATCHGTTGNGDGTVNPTGIRLNKPGQFNRWTRSALDAFATNGSTHEGAVHYPANETDRTDLFARLRGFSGIPGYYLQNPTGSSSDIRSISNVQLAKIDEYNTKGYSVLLIRKLNTGNTDDIDLNPDQMLYNFNFSVTHNDELNEIGITNQQLTFKPKE